MRAISFAILAASLACQAAPVADFPSDPTGWPKVTSTQKPWTRWWWLGSAVDPQNLTRELEEFSKIGIGGVEICPIYGAVGAEDRSRDFLAQEWMSALGHLTTEAKRLDLGVDMTTGTGWPFGGPQVTPELASAGLTLVRGKARGGESFTLKLPKGNLLCIRAWPTTGAPTDLTNLAKDGKLAWQPPAGQWNVIALAAPTAIQKVKRAAPGGQGNVLDPFSAAAMTRYLEAFDRAFESFNAPFPRAQFHDSFEYYGAAWTPEFIASFAAARGYDFRDELPAFAGIGDPDRSARVRSDYRETLNTLHLEYLSRWHDWTKSHGGVTRNQAHGSPGNLLDHYAVSEIPETEIFRHVDENQIPMLKIAASAAHANGNKLVSAETFTWLGEHFQVTPEQLKEAADFVFLGGVNHVFFHGIPYSPDDAKWPGWLFYASTHMGPNGGLWRDLSAFNHYLQRCQSILQDGQASTDVLLYYPIHDLWQSGTEALPLFTVHNQDQWLHTTPFYQTSMELWKQGITFAYASETMLKRAAVRDGKLILGGHSHSALILPGVKFLKAETLAHLLSLSAQGATLIIQGGWPNDVPGLHRLSERRAELLATRKGAAAQKSIIEAKDSILPPLAAQGIHGEKMTAAGLRFVRRTHAEGHHYFIVNRSEVLFDGPLELATPYESAVILDPWLSQKNEVATRSSGIRIRLEPKQSIIIRTFSQRSLPASVAEDMSVSPTTLPLEGPWQIEFLEGGPELPAAAEIAQLSSWTTLSSSAANFSGTARYTTRFELPTPAPRSCSLLLGKVANTARISLNGKALGISWCEPHRIDLSSAIQSGVNQLAIEVTNLAANRIADLDRRKVEWKKFHEINFVNIDYKLFDASAWPAMESGLIGPAQLSIR
jgi:hypothetical protein